MATYRYPIVIEGEETDYSAYAPDLPGCIAAGDSAEEVLDLMQGALHMHLTAMIEDGDFIPSPSPIAAIQLVEGAEQVEQVEVEI